MADAQGSPYSLRVLRGDDTIFMSSGSWLHPLFDLERALMTKKTDPSQLRLEDKIIGKAAALLIHRLGIRTVHAGIISTPAREVFEDADISYSFDESVDLIECATEHILTDISDPDEAYKIISERIAANS